MCSSDLMRLRRERGQGTATFPEGIGVWVRLKSKRIFLARRGALILSLPGMMELIDHHSILYEDLLDPISFFRGEKETKLSKFWPYVFGKAKSLDNADVSRYSDLMSKSQFMVARDTIASIKVSKGTKWLDVGGGRGYRRGRCGRSLRAGGWTRSPPEIGRAHV